MARASLAAAGAGARPVSRVGTRMALRMADTLAIFHTRAMLSPAPRPRQWLTVAVLALMLMGAAGAIDTGTHTEHLFEVARATMTVHS